jgi:hypothetical protein
MKTSGIISLGKWLAGEKLKMMMHYSYFYNRKFETYMYDASLILYLPIGKQYGYKILKLLGFLRRGFIQH